MYMQGIWPCDEEGRDWYMLPQAKVCQGLPRCAKDGQDMPRIASNRLELEEARKDSLELFEEVWLALLTH